MPIKRLAPNRMALNQIRKMVKEGKKSREISKILRIHEKAVIRCIETKAWKRKKLPRSQTTVVEEKAAEETPTRFEKKPRITT